MKVAIAQLNPTIADFDGNCGKILSAYREACDKGAELVVFSELSLCGYPPLDFLDRPGFLEKCQLHLERLAGAVGRTPAVVGCALPNPQPEGRQAVNAAAVLADGRITATVLKSRLPTYDVFDEDRYFEPAHENGVVEVNGLRLGITICEDIWPGPDRRPRYHRDPVAQLERQKPGLAVNLSASPFEVGKSGLRYRLLADVARRLGVPAVLVNQAGGNDQLLFDGRSIAVDAEGGLVARAAAFSEDLLVVDFDDPSNRIEPEPESEQADVYRALVMGIADYARKCGLSRAVLGVSGGIDSAVCAVLACRALGPENVTLLAMPSGYSSPESLELAARLAGNLGATLHEIGIQPVLDSFLGSLEPLMGKLEQTTVEENLQARIRGALVMAFANKLPALPLATGNKSELATGYCTLYGDMVGGLAPLGDLFKTQVYRLAEYMNSGGEVIPARTIERPPSAELRPNQLDSDSLPEYERLDRVLALAVELGLDGRALAERSGDAETAERAMRLLVASEFKRHQAPPVLRVTRRAFGHGWRVPVAVHRDVYL